MRTLPLTYRIVCVQGLAVLAVAAAAALVSLADGLGVLLAGAACVAPNVRFAWTVTHTEGARSAGRLLRAGMVRFVSVACLITLVVVLAQPAMVGFVAGLVTAQIAQAAGGLTLR